jgi:hypothetical protein
MGAYVLIEDPPDLVGIVTDLSDCSHNYDPIYVLHWLHDRIKFVDCNLRVHSVTKL